MSVSQASSPLRETVQRLEDRVDDLRDRVDDLEDENETLRDRVDDLEDENETLRDELQETQTSSEESEEANYELERLARLQPEDLENLSKNKERAVSLWKELPKYAREVKDEFVLTPKELSRFLMDKRGIPLEKAKSDRETQKRIKKFMSKLAGDGGLVRLIDRSSGWFSEKKQELKGSVRIHIKREAWEFIRKDRDVKKLLGTTEA